MKTRTLLALLALVFGLPPALAAGPPTAGPADEQAARQATPAPGKALVYVFRSERRPAAASIPVSIDTHRLAELGPNTFTVQEVEPGLRHVRTGERVLTSLPLEAVAGQTHYVWVEVIPGVTPVRSELRRSTEAAGRRVVGKARFVAAAPPPPPEAARPSARFVYEDKGLPGRPALLARAGSFKLADEEQELGGLITAYDDKSSNVGGAEFEWRYPNGWALGAEYFQYRNDVGAVGTLLTGTQDVAAFMANAKYYLAIGKTLYPYIGVGLGLASAEYSGDVTGSASGWANQAMAGVELRFGSFGVFVEYKGLRAKVEDEANEKVKVDGAGVLGGVSFTF